ncbi:MAG: dihydroneopterin aldolase [Deltaproteobacteria bacterium]|nr:dihydroneopterin aldolase [Deltaproteobacteria bacterium]
MLTLSIKNFKLNLTIGAHCRERDTKQDVFINLDISLNPLGAIKDDDLNNTVDYYELSNKIIARVKDSKFYLIETLASYILDIVFEESKIIEANIELVKPQALTCAQSVSVKLRRTR